MAVKAVEFPEKLTWLNTSGPLSIGELKGQVVLLHFWNLFSPECHGSVHEVVRLEEMFAGRPFSVIGIHSSRYGGAVRSVSVTSAIERFGIRHPVIIDNNFDLWNIYGISLWPSYIIIDSSGTVVGAVSGEGKMQALEKAIARALDDGAGNGTLASAPLPRAEAPARDSLLSFPGKLEFDRDRGHLFVSDTGHNRLIHLELQDVNAKVLNIFGSGDRGFSDGSADRASFSSPLGLSYARDTLYVADSGNHAVRAVTIPGGTVSTIAGTGKQGYLHTFNGNPLKISLNMPSDIANDGVYLYISMAGLNQVWQLDIENSYIGNLVGSGMEGMADRPFSNATLAKPCGLALRDRRLYIADSGTSSLRCADLSTSMVTTSIGVGLFDFGYVDGHFTDARMLHCQGLDTAGEKVFIADTFNSAVRYADLLGSIIRSVISDRQGSTFRVVPGRPGADPLFEPGDVVYYNGRLYIADTGNHRIRVYDMGRQTLEDLVIS